MKRRPWILPLVIALDVLVIAALILICLLVFRVASAHTRRPLPPQTKVLRSYTARVTVYMSEVGQTDSDPFTTANGERVHWGGAAMNCVPFGTKFRVPSVFGSQVFRVNDRGGMPCGDPDIWLPSNDWHGWKGTANARVEVVK